jgi:8-oxo-dGTP pyrophosphatase MutT (NUDIX family)
MKNNSFDSEDIEERLSLIYKESDDFSNLPQDKIGAVCAFCYFNNKFVLVKNVGKWEPVAGHVEKGEDVYPALIREVKEETNMKVLKHFPLASLYFKKGDYYMTQYLCITKPYGDFISDPDGEVSEIKLVDFFDIPKYLLKGDPATLTLNRCKSVLDKIDKIS